MDFRLDKGPSSGKRYATPLGCYRRTNNNNKMRLNKNHNKRIENRSEPEPSLFFEAFLQDARMDGRPGVVYLFLFVQRSVTRPKSGSLKFRGMATLLKMGTIMRNTEP